MKQDSRPHFCRTSTRSGQPPVYNLYNVLGEQVGAFASGITNRTDVSCETISDEVWRVTDSLACAVRSVTREQLTGLSNTLRRHTVAIGANAVTNEINAVWNDTAQTLTETQTFSLRATPTVRVTKYGRTVSETSDNGGRNNFFDPYGRVFYTERRPSGSATWLYETWLGFNDFGDVVEHDTFIGSGDTYTATFQTHDAFGQTLTTTDALGNAVTNAYDILGRPVASSGATYPIRYGYDTMGRMKDLGTTRDGLVWDWTGWLYDPATGLATNKVYADASRIAYTYTPDGKPLRTTWARGEWREQAYNAAGLLAATTYSDTTPTASLAYDAFQRIATASNAVAAYVYANSNLGTATNEMATVCGEVYTLTRRLDDHHRLASLGIGNAPVHYGYDAENRLDTVSNGVFAVDYTYTSDDWDAGYAITLTNGAVLSRSLTRDAYRRGLIKTITNTVDSVPVTPLAYNYDMLNRVTNRNADTFGYNPRSEVTAASILSNGYAYAYDGIGNHTTSSVDSVVTTFNANALNQYTFILCAPAPLREPIFDMDGNMLTNGVWSYTWDADNRMIATYSNTVCVVSNAYDYMSRRVLKVTPEAIHTFVYDGWLPIMETVETASGSATNFYIWGKDLSGTFQGAGGVGGLLAVFLDGAWYFPFYDANGNITAYVDESGAVVAEYVYDAFGGTIAQSGPMADTFAFRFSTKYYDAETGLYYYGYRFYSPMVRRWLNRDPIEENGGNNLYLFCRNTPIYRFDITGCADRQVFVEGVGAGWAGWEITLEGKTALRLSDELFYATGRPQPNMWRPKAGSTSPLLIYKASSPNKVFRLDYHVLDNSASGLSEWHYNRTSGFAKITGLRTVDHAVLPGARHAGKTITVFRLSGQATFVVGAAISVHDVLKADNKVREITRQVGGWTGAMAGARAGSWLGIKAGAAIAVGIGNAGPQALVPEEAVTVPVGMAIGSVAGGFGGGVVGWISGTEVSEKVYDWTFKPLEKEEYIICNEK